MVSGVQVVAGERKRTRRAGVRAVARVQRQRGEHGEQRERREWRGSEDGSDLASEGAVGIGGPAEPEADGDEERGDGGSGSWERGGLGDRTGEG